MQATFKINHVKNKSKFFISLYLKSHNMNIMCSQIGSLLKNKCGKSSTIAMLVNDFLSFTYLYNYKMLPLEKESLSFHLVCNEETNAKRSEPLGLRSLSPQIVQLGLNLRVSKTRVWSFSLPRYTTDLFPLCNCWLHSDS